ncbi:MAG TPA: efflux RND transporter periplasmic adaptor subunit [Thermoanaerobaculia bacterium]|nr:efflux RND transporter periplasmic adaptor subunit [Thermoanaerobaculia bacterium]
MTRRVLAVALSLAALACSRAKAPAPAALPKVVVTPAIQRDEPIVREWIGTTEGDVNADIRPHVEGYLLRRVYKEGSTVAQGELLFEIDPRQFEAQLQQAQANLEQAKAALAKADLDVARAEPLTTERAVSQQELDNARSAQRGARATVGALEAAVAQARLNLSWTRVTSPIPGIAGIAQQQVGDLVNGQTVLTTVSQVNPLRVLYQLSEQEYLEIERDPAMKNAELELVLSDGTVFPHKGRVLLTGRNVDVRTGTIATIGLFPNPGNVLRPGQYAKVRAVVKIRKGAILVPQRAVNEMQGAYQVAVVGADDKVQLRTVKTAERIGNMWVIESGLAAGERVVVEGFSRVKTGQAVTPLDASASPSAASEPPLTGRAGK